MRQRLARQHLVAHCRVIDKYGLHGRGLGEIGGLQPLIHIHIGMVRARAIIQAILDELKTRNADGIKRFVISSSGVAHADRGNAEVFQGIDPLLKDGRNSGVLLQVDAENFSAAIIDIEVAGDFLLIRLKLERTAGFRNHSGSFT